ncbi:MAG: hypothetical protein ABR569_06305 [Gaiellaceae bacterium]
MSEAVTGVALLRAGAGGALLGAGGMAGVGDWAGDGMVVVVLTVMSLLEALAAGATSGPG